MTLIDQLKHAVLTARRTGGTVQVHATPAGDITGFTVPARARLVDLDATPDHHPEHPDAALAPEPDAPSIQAIRTTGPISRACNTGGHIDHCGGCGCTCHRPLTTWSTT